MPVIQNYLNSQYNPSDTYLNLYLDFSSETPTAITQFCEWLKNDPYLNRINFKNNKLSIGNSAPGTNLSKIAPNTLKQLFTAISENNSIQYIELPRCCLAYVLDIEALNAISQCLE